MIDNLATTLPLSLLVDQRHQQPNPFRTQSVKAGLWVGPFRGVKRGQGTDFDELRDYVAGDELRHIDWKTSARRGHLSTRLYREEKEHIITFVADFSRPMFTGSKELLSVTIGRLTAALMWHAIDSGSRTSVMTFNETEVKFSQPATGHTSALAACGLLASTFEKTRRIASDNHHSPKDSLHTIPLVLALKKLSSLGRRVGTVVLLSNFSQSSPEITLELKKLAKGRPIIAIQVEDPMCHDGLPAGMYRYLSEKKGKSTSRVAKIGNQEKQNLLTILRQQQRQIHEVFEDAHVSLIDGRESLLAIKSRLHHEGYLT